MSALVPLTVFMGKVYISAFNQAQPHLRSIELCSRHGILKACAPFVWLLGCLVLFVCVLARSGFNVGFPCCPSTIISLCSAFTNAFHLNCVCRCLLWGRSSAASSSSASCCGLLFEVASTAASSSSRVRVAFPCHGLEALFSFDVCLRGCTLNSSPFLSTFGSFSFSVTCVYRRKIRKRQTVQFPLHIPLACGGVFACRVAALQLPVSCVCSCAALASLVVDVAFGAL